MALFPSAMQENQDWIFFLWMIVWGRYGPVAQADLFANGRLKRAIGMLTTGFDSTAQQYHAT